MNDGDDSSDRDEDHGPSAAPKGSPDKLKSPRTGSIRAGLSRIVASLPAPASRDDTDLDRVAQTKRTEPASNYGVTTSSPQVIRDAHPNPPPLDLGEASVPSDSAMDQVKPANGISGGSVTKSPVDSVLSSPEGSKHRSSDEGLPASESGLPLTDEAQARMKSPKLPPKSPRFLNSPRFMPSPKTPRSGQIGKTPPSPQIGRRSLSKPLLICEYV